MMTRSAYPIPRNILVAVDAGPLSDFAVEAALDLSRRFDAKIELVHAFAPGVASWTLVPAPAAVASGSDPLSKARECVVDHVGEVMSSEHGGRLRADDLLRVIPGRPAKVLLDRAREISADLIVLGALRRRPVIDFGSTARAILAKSKCPVWVQPGPVGKIQRILVPVDLSNESLMALSMTCELAPRFKATVIAMQAFDMSQLAAIPWGGYGAFPDFEGIRRCEMDAFEEAMNKFDWQGVEHETSFVDGLPADEILSRSRKADLVIMGTHGRTGLASALLGSVAYQVLKHTTRPVVVVRRPARKFDR
jgi:nucleotide-binding universal stress UspA family protein